MSIFDFLNFKKRNREYQERIEEEKLRKKQLEEEKLRKKKEFFNNKKAFIDNIVKEHSDIEYQKRRNYEKKENDYIDRWNSSCRNCRSTNVIQIYNRHKGQIDGSLDSNSYNSYSHGLFSGSSYSSSNVKGNFHGELDTLTVNKCKDCGHEWEYRKYKHVYEDNYYYDKIDYKTCCEYLIVRIYDLFEQLENFNPNKLDETCSTLDEKKKELINKIKSNSLISYKSIKALPIELIFYYACVSDITERAYYWDHYRQLFDFGEYKKEYSIRKYMGKFTPKVENLLVNDLGFKYYFNEVI